MNAFVTGASGFIGCHITKRLINMGVHVKALVRDEVKAARMEALGAEPVVGDLRDKGAITGTLRGVDTLYHLGGVSRWWVRDKSEFYRVNVDATRRLMEEALKAGVEKIVHTSSLAAIRQPKGVMSREELPRRLDFESHYARSKYMGEMAVLEMCRESALPAVILNPGVVIGPCDFKTPGRMIIQYLNRTLGAIPFPNTMLPLVYIDDVIEAHLRARERGKPGERYIIVGQNVSIKNFFNTIETLTNIPPPKKTASPLLLKLIALVGEIKSLFTGTAPRLPLDAVRAMEIGAMGANDRAREELGVEFTPLDEALRKTIGWYRDRGVIGKDIKISSS